LQDEFFRLRAAAKGKVRPEPVGMIAHLSWRIPFFNPSRQELGVRAALASTNFGGMCWYRAVVLQITAEGSIPSISTN